MKKLISLLLVVFSLSIFAQSIEEANDLYSRRGDDLSNANLAAKMFIKLAEAQTDALQKGILFNEASKAYYYVGVNTEGDAAKMEVFNKGIDAAINGTKAVKPYIKRGEEFKREVAMGYFRYGSSLGKWAEANGVAASLGRWKNLRKAMNYVIQLGYKSLESYGANRILGRAYYKLPAPLGSKSKSYKYLNEAFEMTKNGQDVSTYGMNNTFYADLLIAVGKRDEARAILTSFVSKNPETLNPERIPETKQEMLEAQKILESL